MNKETQLKSGYTHCACGGCFDTVVSNDMANPDFCEECDTHGCERGGTECANETVEDM